MSQIAVTALSALLPEDVTASHQIIVFTQDGDTERVPLDGAVSQANSNNGCLCVNQVSFTITAAQVGDLYFTPRSFLAALGVGKYPDFIDCSLEFKNGTTAWDTNVGAEIYVFGADVPLFSSTTILNRDGAGIRKFTKVDPTYATGDNQVPLNSGVYIKALVGSPANGDFDIVVHATYVEVDTL